MDTDQEVHEISETTEGYRYNAPSRNDDKMTRQSSNYTLLSKFMRKLREFLKEVWKSLLVVFIIGGITGGIFAIPGHAFDRLFPITFFSSSGDIVWTQFAYPYQNPIISSLTAALVATIIPISVILMAQIWLRSFRDAANGILGLAYAVVTGTFVIVVLKKTIGGLRPHFLSVCEPVIPKGSVGTGYKNIMFTVKQVCTGSDKGKIRSGLESFPSGHSEIAFAGLFYLSTYLFTHLKIQSRHRVEYWRMIACVLPTLLATYIASTLVLNYHHHAHDVIFGSMLGIALALFGYRMVYGSIWDRKLSAVPSCHSDHGREESVLPS